MKRILAILVGIVAVWLGGAAPTDASAPPAPATTYSYDAHHPPRQFVESDSERGPPAVHDHAVNSDAVDRGSDGVSARPDSAASGSTTTYTSRAKFAKVTDAKATTPFTYDHSALLVQVVGTTTTKSPRTGAAGDLGDLSSLERSEVVANTGDDAVSITTRYSRPSGATTRAQREAVQAQPCVECGNIAERQVADHIDPLVKEYYRTGTIDLERMRS